MQSSAECELPRATWSRSCKDIGTLLETLVASRDGMKENKEPNERHHVSFLCSIASCEAFFHPC